MRIIFSFFAIPKINKEHNCLFVLTLQLYVKYLTWCYWLFAVVRCKTSQIEFSFKDKIGSADAAFYIDINY